MYKIIKVEQLKSQINKYDISIVIKDIYNLKKLKNIIQEDIIPKIKKQYNFDELYIGFFEDENLVGYGTTLGYIICSRTGNFTGKYKLNKDLSNMKINYLHLRDYEKEWKNKLSHQESVIFKDARVNFTKEGTGGKIEKENIVIAKIANKYNITFNKIDNIIFKHANHFYKKSNINC